MSGQENSLIHADRGNGVVPRFPESLQEIVWILTQCHRVPWAGLAFRPPSAMCRCGIRRPTKRDFCRDRKDQLARTVSCLSQTRAPNATVTPVEGCGVDPLFRNHCHWRELHLEESGHEHTYRNREKVLSQPVARLPRGIAPRRSHPGLLSI
jgi:hypothetical protein